MTEQLKSQAKKASRYWSRYLLLALLVVVVLCLLTLGLTLRQGFAVDQLSFSGIQVSQAELKWENKLELNIGAIHINMASSGRDRKNSQPPDLSKLGEAMRLIHLFGSWFSVINISKIEAGPVSAQFQYSESETGRLSVHAQELQLQAVLSLQGNTLQADIISLDIPQYRSSARGQLRLDTDKELLSGDINANIANTLPVELQLQGDSKKLSYRGRGLNQIKTIRPIVDLFKLPASVSPWVIDYLQGERFSLVSVSGTVPYSEPLKALDTLRAEAEVKGTVYTFAPGLDPIRADSTKVVFEQRVLTIIPRNSSFYGQDGGDSWVGIDFKLAEPLLTAHIKTRARADKSIQVLLEHYGIAFPFLQQDGLTDADLKLAINLAQIQVQARGRFQLQQGIIEFDQQLFDVQNLDIRLDNTTIDIDTLGIGIRNLFRAQIQGSIDPTKTTGNLDIAVTAFSYQHGTSSILLRNSPDTPLKLDYHFHPDGDTVAVSSSSWHIDTQDIVIDAFTTPFDYRTFAGSIPPTNVRLGSHATARVTGKFSRATPYALMDVELLSYDLDDILLDQPVARGKLEIGKSLKVSVTDSTHWLVNNNRVLLRPSIFSYTDNKLDISSSGISFNDIFDSDIDGRFDYRQRKGTLTLKDLRISNETFKDLFVFTSSIEVKIAPEGSQTIISIPDLALKYAASGEQGWMVTLDDIGKLAPHSRVMQRYRLDSGSCNIESTTGSPPFDFECHLSYPDPLLYRDGKPVNDYYIDGTYKNARTSLSINKEEMSISLAKAITINTRDVGFNMPALLRLSEASKPHSRGGSSGKSKIRFELKARNTPVYVTATKRILADKIIAHSVADKTTLQLQHAEGTANLSMQDQTFSLRGETCGDPFINALLDGSEFENGNMEFHAAGTFNDFKITAKVDNTLIREYTLLNNILAFVNTIPGLLTFQLPSYHRTGLPVSKIYGAMEYQDKLGTLTSFSVESKELSLQGTGVIDFDKRLVDSSFNVIFGYKKSINKLPLVGYVLVGDKKLPSITIRVNGGLDNPTISNTAFKDFATLPFDVLKRTLILPAHLLKSGTTETAPVDSSAQRRSESITGEEQQMPAYLRDD